MKDFYQANTNIQIKKVEWDKKHYLKTTDMFTNDKVLIYRKKILNIYVPSEKPS